MNKSYVKVVNYPIVGDPVVSDIREGGESDCGCFPAWVEGYDFTVVALLTPEEAAAYLAGGEVGA